MNDKNIFYAIGDLHGNAKFLLEALEKIANETKNTANLNVFIFLLEILGLYLMEVKKKRIKSKLF